VVGVARRQPQRLEGLRRAGFLVESGFFAGVTHYIQQYGYFAVVAGILLEDFGLPAPGETLLITAAISASTGALNIYVLLPLAWIGAVIGDNIGYAIGHFGGHRLMIKYGRRIGITDERLKHVEVFFDHYGGWVIVFARFVVILRQLNGIVAGTLGMHWLHFLALNALGAALWVGFWGILSYWLGKGVHVYVHELHQATPLLGGLAIIFLLAGGGYLWWRFVYKARD
jgi:membrane protein DedA with SNARE-associated domain